MTKIEQRYKLQYHFYIKDINKLMPVYYCTRFKDTVSTLYLLQNINNHVVSCVVWFGICVLMVNLFLKSRIIKYLLGNGYYPIHISMIFSGPKFLIVLFLGFFPKRLRNNWMLIMLINSLFPHS